MLKSVRNLGLMAINSLPLKPKWFVYSLPFFRKRLILDAASYQSKLFKSSIKLIVIGANDGLSFDNLFQRLDPKLVSGLVIEPSPKYFRRLQGNLSQFSRLKFFNFAINSDESPLNLYQLNEIGLRKLPDWGAGLGSMSIDHLLKFETIELSDIESIEVEGRNLMNLIIENPNFNEIDYLQIDTEGFDAEIIKTIDFTRFRAKMIKLEWVNLNILDQEIVLRILHDVGYYCYKNKEDILAIRMDQKVVFK